MTGKVFCVVLFCSFVFNDNVNGERISKSVNCRIRIPKARAKNEFVVLTDVWLTDCCNIDEDVVWPVDWEGVGWVRFGELLVFEDIWRRGGLSANIVPKRDRRK